MRARRKLPPFPFWRRRQRLPPGSRLPRERTRRPGRHGRRRTIRPDLTGIRKESTGNGTEPITAGPGITDPTLRGPNRLRRRRHLSPLPAPLRSSRPRPTEWLPHRRALWCRTLRSWKYRSGSLPVTILTPNASFTPVNSAASNSSRAASRRGQRSIWSNLKIRAFLISTRLRRKWAF